MGVLGPGIRKTSDTQTLPFPFWLLLPLDRDHVWFLGQQSFELGSPGLLWQGRRALYLFCLAAPALNMGG